MPNKQGCLISGKQPAGTCLGAARELNAAVDMFRYADSLATWLYLTLMFPQLIVHFRCRVNTLR